MTTLTTPTSCSFCGYELSAAAHLTDQKATPRVGDATVCLMCAGILVYNEQMQPVPPTPEQLREIEEEAELCKELDITQQAILHYWKLKKEQSV